MLWIVTIALAGFYLTNLVRRFPKIESLAMAGVKPWACNACMSFWSVFPVAFAVTVHENIPLTRAYPASLAAAGLCFFLLQFLEPPPPVLPPPPPDAQ